MEKRKKNVIFKLLFFFLKFLLLLPVKPLCKRRFKSVGVLTAKKFFDRGVSNHSPSRGKPELGRMKMRDNEPRRDAR